MDDDVRTSWEGYVDAERRWLGARMALVRDHPELDAVLASALATVTERGCALRLLVALPPERTRPHVRRLVELAASVQADLALVRDALARCFTAEVRAPLVRAAETVLATGGDWEYRRLAELYARLDPGLLAAHLERCLGHPDPAIREVARDLRGDADAEPAP